MNTRLLVLIIGSVSLSALAQLFLKLGMSGQTVQQALGQGGSYEAIRAIVSNLHVLTGLTMYGLGAAVWLLVLAKVDVSFAYPFVGLGFILTMLLGWWILAEPISAARVTGTLFVALGVYLVSNS